jgi:hydrogenase expression/formation protein HypE
MKEIIAMNHGAGFGMTHELIKSVFARTFAMEEPMTDSAILENEGRKLAFTTDSYVVDPVFFPGGDIGKLSICGTVNDLAVSGAVPKYISASFIIEEGFSKDDLFTIVCSMADEARKARVRIVTGDTKVVEKGKCDKIFISTSGVGILEDRNSGISFGKEVVPGDVLIINGPVGNHAIAVLGARNNLKFSTPVVSDCASLNRLTKHVLENCSGIHFMRDLTRGGLAVVLNELATMTGLGILVDESSVPVDSPVRGLCEILGFDPLYLANEGKILFVVHSEESDKVVEIMRNEPEGREAAVVGRVVGGNESRVILSTKIGGRRILDVPSGIQLPRIC